MRTKTRREDVSLFFTHDPFRARAEVTYESNAKVLDPVDRRENFQLIFTSGPEFLDMFIERKLQYLPRQQKPRLYLSNN